MELPRLFIGLPLPPEHLEGFEAQARNLRRVMTSRCSWPRPENRHVTLKFLGETPADRLPDIRRALAGVSWRAFAVQPGAGGFFPSARRPAVIVVGLACGDEECRALYAAIEAALAPLGFPPETRPFSPHVTLARVKRPAPGEDWRAVSALLAKTIWPCATAGRFVLWQSVLGRRGGGTPGPEYVPLGEYPAAGAAETSGPG